MRVAAAMAAAASMLCVHAAAAAAAAAPLVGWTPGVTCPAGAMNDDSHEKYGDMGFEWIGDVVGYPTAHIGNPAECCMDAGGNGIGIPDGPKDDIGLFYSLCNPKLGCEDPKQAYMCTVYANVTGKKPSKGMLSGHAQAPVLYNGTAPTKEVYGGVYYGNPYEGTCKAGNGSSAGKGEVNATVRRQAGGAICAPFCGCPAVVPCPPGLPCPPECKSGILECPTSELPAGTTATPQCMLGLRGASDHTAPWIKFFKSPVSKISGRHML